jgi:hypothetical protein
MEQLDNARVMYKWKTCSNKDTITTFDKDKKPVHIYEYVQDYKDESEAQSFKMANIIVKKLEKFWNDGLHENKKLMEQLVSQKYFPASRTYDFDLPKLERGGYYTEINVKSLDLNNAYARCLLNSKLIDNELYEMMVRLPKKVRLITLGMLAKGYVEYTMNDSDMEEDEGVRTWRYSKYSNLYFYAVQKTTDVMNTIKHILGDSFLFFWVDGIYFKSSAKKKLIDEVIATITTRLPSQRFDYKLEAVPFMRYEKEQSGEQFLFLQKVNSKNGKLEDKEYTFSASWERNT